MFCFSNISEETVAKRLESHFSNFRLHDNQQSVYNTANTTEAALLSVHQDIAEALDNKCIVNLTCSLFFVSSIMEFFESVLDIVLD